MEARLRMTRYIDIFIILTGTIHLLLAAFTEMTLSSGFLMIIVFFMAIIRGVESQWKGKKIASGMNFSLSLIFLIVIVISFI